jgi:hypothetical protein
LFPLLLLLLFEVFGLKRLTDDFPLSQPDNNIKKIAVPVNKYFLKSMNALQIVSIEIDSNSADYTSIPWNGIQFFREKDVIAITSFFFGLM